MRWPLDGLACPARREVYVNAETLAVNPKASAMPVVPATTPPSAPDSRPSADRWPGWVVPLACLLVTGSLLGLSTNLAKLAAGAGVAPLAYLAWSTLGAAVVLLTVSAWRRTRPPLNRRTAEYFLASALVSVAAPNLLFFSAVGHVGAGFVALAIALSPLLTYVGALALRLERFHPLRAVGVVLALAGTAVIALAKLRAPDAATVWIVATLVGPVLLAMGNLYRSYRWPPGAKPEALAPGMLGAAAGLLLLAGSLPGLDLGVPLGGSRPILLVSAQAAAFSLQYLLFFTLQKRGGPVYLSLLGAVGAVVAVPVAVLVLGEAPPAGLGIGAAFIGLGIVLVTRGASRAAPP